MSGASSVDKGACGPATIFDPARDSATILVVEDEVLVRIMVTDELRERGYTVIEAADANEALAVLHSNIGVDLLLTDVRMPGALDGVELAHRVRAEYPTVKVMIASGQMPARAADETVDGFFAKPYDVEKLIGHIRSLLASEKANCNRSS